MKLEFFLSGLSTYPHPIMSINVDNSGFKIRKPNSVDKIDLKNNQFTNYPLSEPTANFVSYGILKHRKLSYNHIHSDYYNYYYDK